MIMINLLAVPPELSLSQIYYILLIRGRESIEMIMIMVSMMRCA